MADSGFVLAEGETKIMEVEGEYRYRSVSSIFGIFTELADKFLVALKFTKWTLVVQVIISLYLFAMSGKLFSTWESKKKEIEILVKRNRLEFRPDTFEVFMRAPCGRLVVRSALTELGKSNEYKNLLKMKKPFFTEIKQNCAPVRTVVYYGGMLFFPPF